MGVYILRGVSAALLVTALTLLAGMGWNRLNPGVLSVSQLLDIGLLASCLVGGFRTARGSGRWLLGGVVGAGYVTVGTLLLALFLPIRVWGFVQILVEGALIGLVAGALGAGGAKSGRINGQVGKRGQVPSFYRNYELNKESTGGGYEADDEFVWKETEEREEWKEAPILKWTDGEEKRLAGRWLWGKASEKPLALLSEDRQPESSAMVELPSTRSAKQRQSGASVVESGEELVKESRPWWEEEGKNILP